MTCQHCHKRDEMRRTLKLCETLLDGMEPRLDHIDQRNAIVAKLACRQALATAIGETL